MKQFVKRYHRPFRSILFLFAWMIAIALITQEFGIYDFVMQPDLRSDVFDGALLLGIALIMLFQSVGEIIDHLWPYQRWSKSELDQLRQIAATGWIVLPNADRGGYDAYGPNGENEWIDHWVDVEERFLTN